MTDSTPALCCEHGNRIDRILELMEDLHAARTPKVTPASPDAEIDFAEVAAELQARGLA